MGARNTCPRETAVASTPSWQARVLTTAYRLWMSVERVLTAKRASGLDLGAHRQFPRSTVSGAGRDRSAFVMQ
jgi:hypothetical protein